MDLKRRKEIIKDRVDRVTDVKLLRTIEHLLNQSSPTQRQYPMSEEEYFYRVSESRKAIADGRLIVQDEAIEYFTNL